MEASLADPATKGVRRLQLVQERIDLTRREQEARDRDVDMADLEEGFIMAAAPYGRRKGLTWEAWRAAGVPATVLTRAGITRSATPQQSQRRSRPRL